MAAVSPSANPMGGAAQRETGRCLRSEAVHVQIFSPRNFSFFLLFDAFSSSWRPHVFLFYVAQRVFKHRIQTAKEK